MLSYMETMLQLVAAGHWHKWVDFAHTFRARHDAIASTRDDPNACMSIEVDRDRNTWHFLNESLVEWSMHFSKPFTYG
jgi:hypothetical protein